MACYRFRKYGNCTYLHPQYPDATGTSDPSKHLTDAQYAEAQERCNKKFGVLLPWMENAVSASKGKGKGISSRRGKGKGKGRS